MITSKCPICDANELHAKEYSMSLPMGRRKISVLGFQKTVCSVCGFEFSTAEQSEHNHKILISRSENVRAGVYPGLLRSIRDKWNLTQRELSKMFGAGSSAVGKWESGASMSGPSALLAQCAENVPGTIEFLAHLSQITLKDADEESYESPVRMHVGAIAKKAPHRHQFNYPLAANASTYHSTKVFAAA